MEDAPQFEMPFATDPKAVGFQKKRISKAFLAAYRAGRRAARQGQRKLPPYKPGNDWRRSFRLHWNEGYVDEETQQPERYEAEE